MFNKTKDYGDLFDVPDFDYSNNGGYGSSDKYTSDSQSNQSRSIIDSAQHSYEAEKEAYRQLRAERSYSDDYEDSDYSSKRRRKKKDKKEKKEKKSKSDIEKKSPSNGNNITKFTRILAWIYLAFMVAFEIALVALNILPLSTLLIVIVVLTLISAIIFVQLYFKNVKSWARKVAIILSIIFIIIYGAGASYAFSTLIFLNDVSVKNDKSVAVTKEPFNVLITGIDTSGKIGDEAGRSDVNMLATVNPVTGIVLLTSIPRDYEVNIVGEYSTDKLTHTGFYGVDMTIDSLEDLFGTTINYYVKVNFTTVVKFVDAIGGVDVVSEVAFTPGTESMTETGVTEEMQNWKVKKGKNHLTGAQALAFARERHSFDTGDNQRVTNQAIVMEAMIQKATSSRVMVLNYNKVLTSLRDYVEMSFSSKEIRQLVRYQLLKNIQWSIFRNQLTGYDAYSSTYTTGSEEVYVMAQDSDSVDFACELITAVKSGEDAAAIQARLDSKEE